MAKTIKAIVNTGKEDTNKSFDVVQGSGAKGKPTRIAAVKGARYELEDPTAKNVGPENIRSKRVGKNLHVMLDGSKEADLIIEGYYDEANQTENKLGLYGRAEDGKLYEYIPEVPSAEGMPVNLTDGGKPVSQVLGGGSVADDFALSGLFLAGAGFNALGAVAGVVGAAALAGGAGGGGTTTGGLTPAQTALAKIEAYNNGNGTTPAAPTVQDYEDAGVTGVTSNNLAAVNAQVLKQNTGGADTAPEVQALVTAANNALAKIEAYNNGNGTAPAALTVQDYADAGITGVTADNLAAVNAQVLKQNVGGADTAPEVQALVTAANSALAKIEAYNNGDGTTPPALTVQDYADAGVKNVTAGNLSSVNAAVLAQNKGGADTVPEVQTLVDGIGAALAKIEAYNNGDGVTPVALTVQDYAKAGITGVTADNLAAVNAQVLKQNVGGADTAPEVQALVTAANSALAKIEAYNNGNGTAPAALTTQDYADAGITGVTADNLAAVNAKVLAQSTGGADTAPEVQALVSGISDALAKIEAYNNGNGVTPVALTAQDYANAGITGVTADNLAAVNAQVLKQNVGGADTIPEVQALVTAANSALAKIEAYNNGTGTVPAALTTQDYADAGITGVNTDNLAAVNAKVLAQNVGGADTAPEVQAIINGVNDAFVKIEAYNNGNGTLPAALTIQDYANGAITGVSADNLAAVNAQVLKQATGGADTQAEVQALVTAANNALAKIEAYNNGNGTTPPALTLQDYADAGIVGVTASNLAAVNATVLGATTGAADTVAEIQTLVSAAENALAKIEAYNNGDGTTPAALTEQDYAAAGITGVTADNLAAVNAQVLKQNVGGADTAPEVQALVTAANNALAKIEAYNNGDGTTPAALTLQDYIDAGITGVNADNLATVNSKVLAQATGGADTVPEVQGLVNDVNFALVKIEAYNNGNGVLPIALTVQDYVNAGITGVTADNLAAVNANVLAQSVGGADTIPEVQALVIAANNALAKIEAYNNGNGTTPPALTTQDYANAGITGVTNDNLAAVNAKVLAQNTGGADTAPEVQALVSGISDALAKIEAYNNGNGVTPVALTVQDYANAGITGVTADNLAAVNAQVLKQNVGGADTIPEVQALVTAANSALAKIEAYNNGDGTSPTALTVQDYLDAGITGVNSGNLAAINAKVLAQNTGGADTAPEVQAIINGVSDALAKIEAYNNGNGTTPPALTTQDYADAGITGVTDQNLAAVNAVVLAQITGGADTVPEVQALVTVAQNALAKIEDYNNGNGTTPAALTVQDYANAGITGVTADNLAAVNAQVLKQNVGGADTAPEVQALVTAANNALAKIEAYNNGNGTAPAALTTQDYADAGITGVTADNLAAVNAQVLKQNVGGADTAPEVQALVTAANSALAKIEAYNNGNGTAPAALTAQDYADAGITGVTADNLAAVNAKVLAQTTGGADTVPEVQALVNTAAAAAASALSDISAAAQANNADGTTHATLIQYTDLGIKGVDANNLAAINSALNDADVQSGQTDTAAKIQTIVDAYNAILGEANDTANTAGNGTPDADPAVNPTVGQYQAIGVNLGTAPTDVANAPETLALLNDIVGASQTADVDTVAEVQELVRIANAIQLTAAGGTPSPALAVADLTKIGLNTTGLTADNLPTLLATITGKANDGTETDTLAKLQALVDALDKVAPVAVADAISDTENSIFQVGNVKTNDTSLDGGETITLVGSGTGSYGTLVLNSSGAYTYTYNGGIIHAITANVVDTFTYRITDAAGNTSTSTLAITVTPVNTAPVNTVPVATQTLNEDATKVITGLSIADVDAGSSNETVTLAVGHGSVTVLAATGVTITGNGTASVQLVGTVSAINAALAAANGVTYAPTTNYNGTDTLTMTTNDGGNTGAGGAKTDADTVNISIAAVNDAPTGGVTITGAVKVGQTLTASTTEVGNVLADVDGLGTLSYKWFADGQEISGATASTYVLTANELSKTITATVSYTDGGGTAESKTSAATAAVVAVTAGDPIVDLGASGKLIAPVQVEGKWYYYWDRSGDGTANAADQSSMTTWASTFNHDINGNVNPAGAYIDDTYRYGTVNGVLLALPSLNGNQSYLTANYNAGTAATGGGTTNNSSYDGLLAVWDNYNGTGVSTNVGATALTGWATTSAQYWAATQTGGKQTSLMMSSGYEQEYALASLGPYTFYTALEVVKTNAAPVLDATQSPAFIAPLGGVTPANGVAAGALVSSLVGGVSDTDSGATKGIAITGFDSTNGTLYFSTNGGTTWTAATGISSTNALLLAADADTRIYFKPAVANYSGTTSPITFRAWDMTQHITEGVYADTSVTGGKSEFSTATDTISVTVSASAMNGDGSYSPTWSPAGAANAYLGEAVTNAGDFNGDGIDDYVVVEAINGAGSPSAYVVYGNTSGTLPDLSSKSISASQGVKITTTTSGALFTTNAMGDLNGDGYADIAVGDWVTGGGQAYVIYGGSNVGTIDVSSGTINASKGLKLMAGSGGLHYSGAGDVNGDGLADWAFSDTSGHSVHVMYGTPTYGNLLNITSGVSNTLTASQGFDITNLPNNLAYPTVTNAGDVNGDGLADLLVQAANTSATTPNAYVVYGNATGADVDVTTLAANGKGFAITGSIGYGIAASGLGDVNGDGYADITVSTNNNLSVGHHYVIYGSSSAADVAVSSSMGSTGLEVLGLSTYAYITNAGDMNGDGLADMFVNNYGSMYVIYGSTNAANLDLTSGNIAPSNGFKVSGTVWDSCAAGDINGDGLSDVLLGAGPSNSYAGSYGVIFGGTQNVSNAVNLTGTSASEAVLGTSAANTLTGSGGVDRFFAGDGNDTIILTSSDTANLSATTGATRAMVNGGGDFDTIQLTGGANLNLTAISNIDAMAGDQTSRINSIERIDLATDGVANTLTIAARDVNDMAGFNLIHTGTASADGATWSNVSGGTALSATTQYHQVVVDGTNADVVNLAAGSGMWANAGTVNNGSSDYTVWQNASTHSQVIVKSGVTVNNLDTSLVGDAVISLGASGNLIAPVQVEGKWYYYWDRDGDGSTGTDQDDRVTHDALDSIFKYDINGNLNPTGDTTDTYRYAVINGVKLALPTINGGMAYNSGTVYSPGTAANGGGAADNSTYDGLLATWDNFNGTGTGTNIAGVPPGWTTGYYLSSTQQGTSQNHAALSMGEGVVTHYADTIAYWVALEVLPVVIDLNRDGILNYGQVTMDVNGDGALDVTKWAGAQDGVLVWDKFHDGLVHDNSQYAFAQYATTSAANGKTATDLSGLADAFDSNHDGVFNAADAQFAEFKVWQDANQNGVSDAGEVRGLLDWGITSINLSSDNIVRTPTSGVTEAGRTTATATDGSSVLVSDAAFEYHTLTLKDVLQTEGSPAPVASNQGVYTASGSSLVDQLLIDQQMVQYAH